MCANMFGTFEDTEDPARFKMKYWGAAAYLQTGCKCTVIIYDCICCYLKSSTGNIKQVKTDLATKKKCICIFILLYKLKCICIYLKCTYYYYIKIELLNNS